MEFKGSNREWNIGVLVETGVCLLSRPTCVTQPVFTGPTLVLTGSLSSGRLCH